LGIGYKRNLDVNNSIQYFLKAVNLAKKINCKIVLIRAYDELGNLIYIENLNLNLALYYLNLSIKYANDENSDINYSKYLNSKVTALIDRSAIYLELGKIKESFNDLFLAKSLIIKLPNGINQLKNININLAATYVEIGDQKNCEKYINEALKIALALNNTQSIKETYRYMADFSFIFKDYYKAIFYSLKSENYNDKSAENIYSKIYMDSLLSI
jgi:hypothetical protein